VFATNASAAEIITVDDFEQKIVTKEHLIKTADNAIILFDASVSMNETYKDQKVVGLKTDDILFKHNKHMN
jgi:fructose-specific phosphotransferase system component IIB